MKASELHELLAQAKPDAVVELFVPAFWVDCDPNDDGCDYGIAFSVDLTCSNRPCEGPADNVAITVVDRRADRQSENQLNASVSEALRLIALGRIGEAQVVLHAAQERLDERVAAEAQS